MLICYDCGKMVPAAENKFKFEEPDEPGPVYVCQACGTQRLKKAKEQEADA